jgi:hypothetical protein
MPPGPVSQVSEWFKQPRFAVGEDLSFTSQLAEPAERA